MKRWLVILLLLFFFGSQSLAQVLTTEGNDFWLAFLPNHKRGELAILVSGDQPTTGMVVSSDSSWSQTFSVIPGVVTRISVPDSLMLGENLIGSYNDHTIWGSEVESNKSFHVTTEANVSLYASNYISASYDITNVLPTATLGQQYILQTMPQTVRTEYEGESLHSALGVVAIEDSTEVFIELVFEDSVVHHQMPTSYMLNKGQTFLHICRSDLSNSRVWTENCKRIAVFEGHECAYVPISCSACDHLVEQAIPTLYWGRKFGLTTSKYRTSDIFKITAMYDSTVVRYEDASFMLNARESRILNITRPSDNAGFYLEGSKPISVFLYMKGGECAGRMGDPSSAVIHPIEQQFSSVTFPAYNTGRVNTHCINIVTRKMYAGNIYLDNGIVDTALFSPLSGNDEYVYTRINVSHGNHTLTSTYGGFVAHEYGLGEVESYAYAVGATLDPINPQSFLNDRTFAMYDSTNNVFCLGDTFRFRAEVVDEYNTDIVWNFGDGDTATGIAVVHNYLHPGDYTATVSYTYYNDCYQPTIYTHTLLIHIINQQISVTDTIVCDTVCVWNDQYYYTPGGYSITIPTCEVCDSLAKLNIELMRLPPQCSVSYEYDCDSHVCHISASGTGDYLRWNSVPYNPELSGHEGDSVLDVTPGALREYSLYMAYSNDVLCSTDTSFNIPQIDVFKALISANPPIVDLDHTTVILADVSPDAANRVWYIDGSEISRSQKVEYDYPVSRDSVVITLAATSTYGCHDTAELALRLVSDGIYIPNIVTPTRLDNNYFEVVGNSLMDGEIWIFDRRGAQVWYSNDIHAHWDATYKGTPLPQGTYVYTLRYRHASEPDVWLSKTGTVTVIR